MRHVKCVCAGDAEQGGCCRAAAALTSVIPSSAALPPHQESGFSVCGFSLFPATGVSQYFTQLHLYLLLTLVLFL